jgi:hypothetical protein
MCRAHKLDPLHPLSFAQQALFPGTQVEFLPESFRNFVKEYRPQWEDELRLRNDEGADNSAIRYARSSDDETVRLWAWAYEFALDKQRKFDAAPRSWWANLISSLKKSHDTVQCQLAPSIRKCLVAEHYPKLFEALDKAKWATLAATTATSRLESEIRRVGESIQREFQELETTRPDILKIPKVP